MQNGTAECPRAAQPARALPHTNVFLLKENAFFRCLKISAIDSNQVLFAFERDPRLSGLFAIQCIVSRLKKIARPLPITAFTMLPRPKALYIRSDKLTRRPMETGFKKRIYILPCKVLMAG
jgi:hypothetical protein